MDDYGPLMIDLEGIELTALERDLLKYPGIGGVILYARNFSTPAGLKALVSDIRFEAQHPILIATDHEGGKMWQFFEGFTHTPTAAFFGQRYDVNKEEAVNLAKKAGFTMATDLISYGIDFSFAPVLDLDRKISPLIGERAFNTDPNGVVELAGAFIDGMKDAGMKATGKHFPGHGGVPSDTHLETAIDPRKYELLYSEDMMPFAKLAPKLGAMMPAHIIYPAVDNVPVGYSKRWLNDILRNDLQFSGAIISDCLSMKGAAIGGDHVLRARLALEAGCDMVMLCQQTREQLKWVLDNLGRELSKEPKARLGEMAAGMKVRIPEMMV